MCAALRRSDYYETSVPPHGPRSATDLPDARLEAGRVGRPEVVPTFTTRSIGQGGAQLYSGNIPAVTPQTFTAVTRHPPEGHRSGGSPSAKQEPRAASGPDPPGSSRYYPYGASTTGSLSLHLLTSLAEPGPSGSTDPSRRCQGCFPPSPAFPGSGCPQLHLAAATAKRWWSLTSTRSCSASWRTLRR